MHNDSDREEHKNEGTTEGSCQEEKNTRFIYPPGQFASQSPLISRLGPSSHIYFDTFKVPYVPSSHEDRYTRLTVPNDDMSQSRKWPGPNYGG